MHREFGMDSRHALVYPSPGNISRTFYDNLLFNAVGRAVFWGPQMTQMKLMTLHLAC